MKVNKSKIDHLIIGSIMNYIKTKREYRYYNFTYHAQKHKLIDILKAIIFILKTGLPWAQIEYVSKINYKTVFPLKVEKVQFSLRKITVYKAFGRLCYLGIIKNTYLEMLNKYINKSPSKKLKMQYVDSTIIGNKYGREKIGRSKLYKNKYTTKISFITDSIGIPIYMNCEGGNRYDSRIIVDNYKDFLIDKNYNREYNKYFLGDKGYCSEELRQMLRNDNYVPIIDYNNRGTKNPAKIRKLTKKEYKIYQKRITIEHTFGKLKKRFRRIDLRYDGKIKLFETFIYLSLIWLLKY